jgi:FlaA1/EpsC-like NDP-sugar epimerase
MEENLFFKPTPLYKEFMILDIIAKDSNVTQRKIGDALGIAVSMVNYYLDEYEAKGYLSKEYLTSKTVRYAITKSGIERRKVLNIGYLNATLQVHNAAKANIIAFLNQIIERGYRKVILYGAGEVTESMLNVLKADNDIGLSAVAVIDDDVKKQGSKLVNTPIIALHDIMKLKHDGVLISSYSNHVAMYAKLLQIAYPKERIISFFED